MRDDDYVINRSQGHSPDIPYQVSCNMQLRHRVHCETLQHLNKHRKVQKYESFIAGEGRVTFMKWKTIY
jgi:hypothetical protein